MLRRLKCVRYVAREIADAADGALTAYGEDRVVEEPHITDRILGAIEDRVESLAFRSQEIHRAPYRTLPPPDFPTITDDLYTSHASQRISWRARTLRTGRGVAAEEKRHGADLLGVLDLNLVGYRVTKGFLVQAKRAEPDQQFSVSEWNRLRIQCKTMLDRSPHSFVWVYSRTSGIRIFSACAVIALQSRTIFDLYSRSMSNFFEYHIESFFGDHRLNSPDIQILDALAGYTVDRVFEVSATQS